MRLKSQLIAHFEPWSLGAVTLGHEDLVESCDARAHDTREWDLKVNGDAQTISK